MLPLEKVLKAGFSKVCISPSGKVELAGFSARQGLSTGIHDELYVRALFLEGAHGAVLLMCADLLALPESFVERVRGAIHAHSGIERKAILVACTHTHAAPVTITSFFNPDQTPDDAYLDRLAIAFERCAAEAVENIFEARLGAGSTQVPELGKNRRSEDGLPMDRTAGIIRVDDSRGRTRAALINYGCHPTVLGPDNHLVTGDFPAFALKGIEEALGGGSLAMFLNGAEGNVGPGHSSELSAIGVVVPGRTFERAAELGATLAKCVLEALPRITTVCEPEIRASAAAAGLPRKQLPSPDVAEQALAASSARLAASSTRDSMALRQASSNYLYASITNYFARKTEGMPFVQIELQGFRIGDTAWIAVPAEVFTEIGLRLKGMAAHPIFLIAVANGYIGYLPTKPAFAVGGYEVVASPLGPDAEERFLECATALAHQLLAT
jgi:neutral/alkaline ceramidase-like enzyme